MRSILTDWAKQQIRQTAQYIRKEFGKKRCDVFMHEVRQARRLIEAHPNAGSAENLLSDLPKLYRSYVMNRYNKMVYRVEGDIIYIVDFWDVRRDPRMLVSQVN